MPRFTDILASDILTDPTDAQFSVDVSVPERSVSAIGPAPGSAFALSPGADSAWFQPRDKIIIKSLWTSTPHGFRQGIGTPAVGIAWADAGLNLYHPLELSSQNGVLQIPPLGGSLDFPPDGLLLDPALAGVPTTGKIRLFLLSLDDLTISMAGVPAILDLLDFNVQVFLQVLHTIETTPNA